MNAPRDTTAGADFVALPRGQTIGRYEVLGVLGHGGFGITYRARDSRLSREVAIKEYLPPALAVRQDGETVLPRSPREADDFAWGRTRFVEEGRTLAGLQKSPAIVRVYDFMETNGTAYIVMELVHGETLGQRLKRTGPLAPAAIDRLLWPLLDGLTRVHATGFLHRDIKPSNILLDAEGDPTLIDFGASRAAMADRSASLTAVFTPGYAAAEQVTSMRQGPWTDIYALSATLYHAIAGNPPPNVFDRMTEDRCRPLALLQPRGFRRSLLLGLDAGLAVKASDRPQTIAAWRSILGQTASGDDAVDDAVTVALRPFRPIAATAPDIESVPRQRKRNGLGSAFAGAAVVALAVGGYFAWTAREGVRPAVESQSVQPDRQSMVPKAQSIAVEAKPGLDERKAAEAAETSLRLGLAERQKVQVALTAAGFDTRGSDGWFGPRSREMIAAWQKIQNQPATGFLTAAQFQALQREAAALARQEEARRKTDEGNRKPGEEPHARESVPSATATTPSPFDGSYGGFFSPSGALAYQASASRSISVRVANGSGTGTMVSPGCGPMPLSLRISATGDVAGEATGVDAYCARFPLTIQGRAANGQMRLTLIGASGGGSATLVLGVPSRSAGQASSATPGSPPGVVDGVYRGSLTTVDPTGPSLVLGAVLQLAGTRLSGQISSPTCGPEPIVLNVLPSGEIRGEIRLKANSTCSLIALTANGRLSGGRLALELRGAGLRAQGTLDRRGD